MMGRGPIDHDHVGGMSGEWASWGREEIGPLNSRPSVPRRSTCSRQVCSLVLSSRVCGVLPVALLGQSSPCSGTVQAAAGSLTSLSLCTSQAGCENPSISLHVIGLNGPTHDLEMMPPDDPRMRFASFPELRQHIIIIRRLFIYMVFPGSDVLYCSFKYPRKRYII